MYQETFSTLGINKAVFDSIAFQDQNVTDKLFYYLVDCVENGDDETAATASDLIRYINSDVRQDEDNWVTINGTHTLLNEEGVAQGGGKLKGMTFSNAKSQKRDTEVYNGKTEFKYGSRVSQETMNNKLQELRRNQPEGEPKLTSAQFEKMAENLIAYGFGDECTKILYTQAPEYYKEYIDRFPMTDAEKREYTEKAQYIEDYLRLSDKYDKPVYRALSFLEGYNSPEEIQSCLDQLKPGNEIDMGHISSWAKNYGTAVSYADDPMEYFGYEEGRENYSVIYKLRSPKSVVDIGDIKPAEGEALSPKSMRIRVKSVIRTYNEEAHNHRYYVEIEEI